MTEDARVEIDDLTHARLTKFITDIFDKDLNRRFDDTSQDLSLSGMGTQEEWNQLVLYGLAPFLSDLIAKNCVSGLKERIPSFDYMTGEMTTLGNLPVEYFGFEEDPDPRYLGPAVGLLDAAIKGEDSEEIQNQIIEFDSDGQAQVIFNSMVLFVFLIKAFKGSYS